MISIARPAALAVSTGFGVLMVGLAAIGAHGPAVAAGAAAVVAVGVGLVFRPAATLAVLLSAVTILVSDPSLVFAAWSGLCAAAYLICRHAVGAPAGVVMWSWPTLVAAVGFTFAGLVAASFPLQLPWLPLAAPLAVLAIYALATRPFLS
ncbi:MAG: hypothetical protein ACLP4W_29160 [Mycobacterium sp.]|uniref:hypothetical protein n=1 Tax=Mycobacterium sp. TaxID=1785 RepID=UPI003F9B66A0